MLPFKLLLPKAIITFKLFTQTTDKIRQGKHY